METKIPAYLPIPMESITPPYQRPPGIELCYQAARQGDVAEVKKQVHHLLHESQLVPAATPDPAWLSSSLEIAIQHENLEIVQFLLNEDVAQGDLPIESAVRQQAKGVLELFLQHGWDINQPMRRNEPPALSIPLSISDQDMVEWFINHGADPNSRCAWDLTPTSYAVYAAPLETIDYLFSKGADIQYGQLLHHAVLREKSDTLEVVRRLVKRGAPINEIKYETDQATYREREPFGLGTPLHRAAEFGKKAIVIYLLKQGADSLKLDSKGKTPRFWAESRDHKEVAQVLREDEENRLKP